MSAVRVYSIFYIAPMMDSIRLFLETRFGGILDHSVIQRLFVAMLLLVAARLLLIFLKHVISHAENRGLDSSAKPLVYSLFSYCIYIVTLLLVLHVLGVNTAGIVALVGAASLAVGLALKDALANIASGLLLLFLRPFKAGDYIECGNIKGNIIGIGLFNTTLRTLDGLYVSSPNTSLWGQPIVNFSKNPLRRLEITVGIDYGDSPEKALDIMRDVVATEPLFMRKPEPQFFVSGLEDSAVNVTFRAWTRTQDYFNLRWKYTAEIKKRFDEEKITIPFPQRVVHFVDCPQGPV